MISNMQLFTHQVISQIIIIFGLRCSFIYYSNRSFGHIFLNKKIFCPFLYAFRLKQGCFNIPKLKDRFMSLFSLPQKEIYLLFVIFIFSRTEILFNSNRFFVADLLRLLYVSGIMGIFFLLLLRVGCGKEKKTLNF